MLCEDTKSHTSSDASHAIDHDILLALQFVSPLIKFTKRDGDGSINDTNTLPLRFASDIQVSSIFNGIESFKFENFRVHELIFKIFHFEPIIASDVEVTNSEVTVDYFHFFALFGQNNELLLW